MESEFEKARMEYCEQVYQRETERKETLEKKAQFYLSLITLLLGAIFFNLDFLKTVRDLLNHPECPALAVALVYVAAVVMGIGLAYALAGVLDAMRLQSYKNEYPARPTTSLFSPDSVFLEKQDVESFHRATATGYILAVESNSKINDRKAVFVKRTSYGVFVATAALMVFLGTVVYLNAIIEI